MQAWCVYVCTQYLNVKCFLTWITVKMLNAAALGHPAEKTGGCINFLLVIRYISFPSLHDCLLSGLHCFREIYCSNLTRLHLQWCLSHTVFHVPAGVILLTSAIWPQPTSLAPSPSFHHTTLMSSHTARIPVPWILLLDSVPKRTWFSARKAFAFFLSLIAVHLIFTLSEGLSLRPLLLRNTS